MNRVGWIALSLVALMCDVRSANAQIGVRINSFSLEQPFYGHGGFGYGGFGHGGFGRGGFGGYSPYFGHHGPHFGIPSYQHHSFRPYAFPDYSFRSYSFSVPLQPYGHHDFGHDRFDHERFDDRRLYGDRGGYVFPRQDYDAWQSPDITDHALERDPGFGNPDFDRPLEEPRRVFGWSDERLLSDATTLQRGLLARPDDADVWMDYLKPDLIIANAQGNTSFPAMQELLRNYEGVSGNASLSGIWTVPGFRETHHGLAAWIDRRGGMAESPKETAGDLPEPENDADADSDSTSPISL